jgi:hypothetical protein
MFPRTPFEALESLIWKPHRVCTGRYRGPNSKPGLLIEDASPEIRELLKKLTSDDVNVRPDAAERWIGLL